MVLTLMANLGWLPVEVFWGEVPEEELPEYREGSSYFLQGMLIAAEMPFAQAVTMRYWRPSEVSIHLSNGCVESEGRVSLKEASAHQDVPISKARDNAGDDSVEYEDDDDTEDTDLKADISLLHSSVSMGSRRRYSLQTGLGDLQLQVTTR
jgi:hypothetical protein